MFFVKEGTVLLTWICNFMFFNNFFAKYLVNSPKSSTFAPCFSWY